MHGLESTWTRGLRALIAVVLATSWGCAAPATQAPSDARAEVGSQTSVVELRVRVWADTHYRREHHDWREHVERQVRLVNDTLGADLDATLRVVEMQEWAPEADSDDLDALLEELEREDHGERVELVVGLTAALPFGDRNQRRLGYSSLLGKHMLVRGVDPVSDVEQVRSAMPSASRGELEREAQLRAEHRERTTMLHELGHILGAVHTVSEDWLMSPVYRKRQRGFSPKNTEILRLSVRLLAESDSHDAWKRAVARRVEPMIEGGDSSEFMPEDAAQVHQHMLALLEPDSLTANEARRFNGSQDAAQSGDFEQALAMVEPLLETRPNHPLVISAVCQFRVRLEVRDEQTLRMCARAMEARPDDPLPGLFLAHMHVDRGEVRQAMETMRRVERRLTRGDEAHPRDYLVLAVLYQRVGAVARAEDAAMRAEGLDGAEQVLDWARKLRRTWGLPRGVVSAQVEYLVAEKLREFDRHIRADHFEAAQYIAERVSSEFPDTAMAEVAYCRLLTARGQMKSAVPYCRRAIARDASAAMAHYVIGVWEMTRRDYQSANEYLTRAVSLTPSVRGFWHSLATLYREAGSTEAYRSVARDYRERFGEALPDK